MRPWTSGARPQSTSPDAVVPETIVRDSAGRGVLAVARPPLVLCGRSEEEHLGIPRPRAYRRVRADEEDRARADRVDEITIEPDVALAAAVVDHLPRGSP